jgi:hypothetical protein
LVFKAPMPVIYTTALYSGTPFPIVTLLTKSLTLSSNSTSSPSISKAANTAIATSSASASVTPDPATPSLAIGLGTGLGGGAVIALGVGWFFLWRRRKREDKTAKTEPTSDKPPEMMDQSVAEKSGKERFEIQDQDPPTEVVGDMYRAELPASTERESGTLRHELS